MRNEVNRRRFIKHAAAVGGAVGLSAVHTSETAAGQTAPLQPIGEPKGIHPGRVVWVHDPKVSQWKGPGHGHWYDEGCINQGRVDAMMKHAICRLTGEATVTEAWSQLFRHLNVQRGKGRVSYRAGERIVIKPNWVGMIWREGAVDPESYTLIKRQDYMNTAPQMIIALVRQLVENVGVKQNNITVCDTLAYLVHEYYSILHRAFPSVNYEDYAGKFGRSKVNFSSVPLYWSCRPEDVKTDYVPECMAQSEYLINFANLKAHTAAGVTLCGKNHFGSLIRWPVQQGYYNMHANCFAKKTGVYRETVDLMGHTHLGGKTVLCLVDGLFPGKHPIDSAPRKWNSPPFQGEWASSLLASQDPVAVDSVGLDFLRAEWDDYPRREGADDYLHEAALAGDPPSGTFYDPDHGTASKRLSSLGVHEHWNNSSEKKYSRNFGTGEGIELVTVQST